MTTDYSTLARQTEIERRTTQRLFQRVAFSFHAIDRFTIPGYRSALARLALPADWDVLDLATGSGAFASVFAERGHRVTGLDFSPRLLRRAHKRFDGAGSSMRPASWLLMDLIQLPELADDHYAVVAMSQLLHGLSDALRAFTLREAARIARERVVIFDYTARGPWYIRLIEWLEGPYFRHYLRRPVQHQLEEAGLDIEAHHDFGYVGCWVCRPIQSPVCPCSSATGPSKSPAGESMDSSRSSSSTGRACHRPGP